MSFIGPTRAFLDRIPVPTLVIHRSGNRHVSPSYSKWVAPQIPGARYLELPGEDHVPHLGDTAPVLTAIERFLQGAPSTLCRSSLGCLLRKDSR
jgi:eukaryotic-like serine/threonine-protein kinase